MKYSPPSSPLVFKGIALFTPGGDLVYCIDPQKQNRWHLQLCATLQELLGLIEVPHFLATCFAATVDRWQDPATHEIRTVAEASPLVMRHQALLNAVFGIEILNWTPIDVSRDLCEMALLERYRLQFPELWEHHDLVVRFEGVSLAQRSPHADPSSLAWSPQEREQPDEGFVFRLFISGHNTATEQALHSLHYMLERSLQQPYTLKVIDIYKNPEQAESNQVTATPTLVKVWPPPVRRVVGNLDNISQFISVLSSTDRYGQP